MQNVSEFYENKEFQDTQLELKEKRIEIEKGGLLGKVVKALNSFAISCESILDIGGGSGINLVLYSEATGAKRLCSLDIREPKLKLPEIQYFKMPIEKMDQLGLPKFDVIVLTEVIEHIFDPDNLIENAIKLLNDHGILIITTPNLSGFLNIVTLSLGFQPVDTEVSVSHRYGRPFKSGRGEIVGHIRVFTLRALSEMLHAHGLEIVSLKSCGRLLADRNVSFSLRLISVIDRCFSHLYKHGGTRMIAVCKKMGGQRPPQL